jgi:nicotinamide mononucleotide transporter
VTIVKTRTEAVVYALAGVVSATLLLAARAHWIPSTESEAWGFVTGGWCVWLAVKQNIWNWPIGLLNNVVFVFIFLEARLYADMALQGVYFTLGAIGWYIWLFGGQNRTQATIATASVRTLLVLGIVTVAGTAALTVYLRSVHDAAPFLDAFTTMLSLVAQALLTRKYIENWMVWIFADAIYIGLYAYKNLYLTAILYAVFLAMCIVGLTEWRQQLRASRRAAELAPASGF